MSSRWQNYIQEFIRLLQVYVFAVVYLGIFRIVLIVYFSDKLDGSTSLSDIFLAIAHGYRFDSAVAVYFILVPFLANAILAPFNLTRLSVGLRTGFSGFMLLTLTICFVVTIPYFREYDSQFDYFLFEILYDDRYAIMRTIIDEYNLFGNLIMIAVVSMLCFFLLRQWQKLSFTPVLGLLNQSKNLFLRSVIVILIFLLTFAAVRGSFRSKPVMRKWADVTTDAFLNNTVMNPLMHLQYAYKDFKSINSSTAGIRKLLGDVSVMTAARRYFPLELSDDQAGDLSNYLLRTASGNQTPMPDHIFLIVMESYDSWPLMPRYKSLKIAENLRTLGENGIFFNHFLPAASNTMGSLSAILTGIPYTGVNISRIAARKPPFITSIPGIFKRLGYKTRLYYGGFLSWQNIGNFSRAQGIDEIFGAPSVEKRGSDRVWGVEDEQLFKFVQTNTIAGEKTFNIILTTSYHSPYNIDVKSKGFSLDEIPENIKSEVAVSIPLNLLGHFWYCDKQIGDFVEAIEKAHPSCLFAMTGDHYGRRFLNSRPSIYEHSSVPFVLYGKRFIAPQGTSNPTPGSHIDIVPTIVELIAPAGFQYHTFGRSMLGKHENGNASSPIRFGIGYQTIVADNFIVNLKIEKTPAPLPDVDFVINSDLFQSLELKHNQLLGLGWWLIFRGHVLDTTAAID